MRSPIQVWPVNHRLPNGFPVSEMSRFKRLTVKMVIGGAVVLVIAGVVLARL